MFGYLCVAFIVGCIAGVCIMGLCASNHIHEIYREEQIHHENALKLLVGIYQITDYGKDILAFCEDEELAHAFCREWGPKLKSPTYLLVDEAPSCITWENIGELPEGLSEYLKEEEKESENE